MPDPVIDTLKEKARALRKEILDVIYNAGSGHPGGSLSCLEILMSLYLAKMNHKPDNPQWQQRDRFIMSKGHACSALYAVLAECGYFPKEDIRTFRKLGSVFQGHAYAGVPGVELSTGSLGQGLSVAGGIALAGRLRKAGFSVFCLLGDGEIQEGQVWEAAMTAAHHRLDNLCAIVDYNGVQQNGYVSEIKNEEPLLDKWMDFGWHSLEVDGHNFTELFDALDEFGKTKEKPTLIKAKTVKGKGVSFMENQSHWHGKAPNKQEFEAALKELGF